MNIDEVKEWMSTDEGKEFFAGAFDDHAKEQGFKKPDEIQGLVKKKDELLGKLAKLKEHKVSEDQRKIISALDELEIRDYNDFEDFLDNLKGTGDEGQKQISSDLERELKRKQKELDKHVQSIRDIEEKYKVEHGRRLSSLKQAELTKALKKVNIKDTAFDMAYAHFNANSKVEEDEDGNIAILATDELGSSIDSFIEEWSKTDSAKDFIQKPINVGAGIGVTSSDGSKTTFTRADLQDPETRKKMAERMKKGEKVDVVEK